jgi:DNA-binding MarR family transcriptional regulator
MTDDWKNLDPRAMPGHLARRLQQLAVALFNEEVAELGLTPVQYAALHAVCSQPGVDQKSLAQSISYDAATIGGVLDRMEARGLVARSPSPLDRRVRLVTATAQGEQMLQDVIPRMLRAQDRMLAPLAEPDRQALLRMMAVLIDANQSHASTPSRE